MNGLSEQILCEIVENGPMRFSRFMELALYAPGLGYYEKQAEIGRRGDFYTSVSVGNLFGRMLARQFTDWIQQGTTAGKVQWVETGAHRGQLAADILDWTRERAPELFSRLEYWIVEPSATRRTWQAATLNQFTDVVNWADDLKQVAKHGRGIEGIIFSNELLDAMPVHRLRWSAASQVWEECLVDVGPPESGFVWRTGALGNDLVKFVPQIPVELAAVLPDGFAIEISPAAIEWWHNAARALVDGLLLTFDYGLCSEEFLVPERRQGTLRAYAHHQVSTDVLANPGEQDITAHVNFSGLKEAGREEGLETVRLSTQREFLIAIFERILKDQQCFEPWTTSAIRQFQTLTHPDHLGRAFRILVQRRAS